MSGAARLQAVLHIGEGAVELRADALHHRDGRDRDARGNQAIFDRRGTGLVCRETPESFDHHAPRMHRPRNDARNLPCIRLRNIAETTVAQAFLVVALCHFDAADSAGQILRSDTEFSARCLANEN